VAERYGFPRRTLYYWLANRILPHTRVGTRVFIDVADLEELKRKNRIEAVNAK
jgi:excisionase family DNA binding protein